MKPYFSNSGAWVQFERLGIPSGDYLVTLYAPNDDTFDRIRCDTYSSARAYFKVFKAIAKNWGKS